MLSLKLQNFVLKASMILYASTGIHTSIHTFLHTYIYTDMSINIYTNTYLLI